MNADRHVAVVTGGSSGIGLALAALLLGRGFHVVLVARDPERLATAVAELGGAEAGVEAVACDVSADAEVAALADDLLGRLRRVDLLVCCAGVAGRRGALDTDVEAARRVVSINYLGMVSVTRALWPGLAAARGRVVNVASIAGSVAVPSGAPYSASKSAAVAWSRALRAAARPTGITVTTVNPGPVSTPGFPQRRVLANPLTRWVVISDARCARAILHAVDHGRAEIYVPGWWRAVAVLSGLFPNTLAQLAARRWAGGGSGGR